MQVLFFIDGIYSNTPLSIISPGTIDIDEMIDILMTFYDMEGVPRDESIPYADKIFKILLMLIVMALWTKRSSAKAA
jgi:hypothetical protein